jgi:hypothetical protein
MRAEDHLVVLGHLDNVRSLEDAAGRSAAAIR